MQHGLNLLTFMEMKIQIKQQQGKGEPAVGERVVSSVVLLLQRCCNLLELGN